jgi:hypothetical protein
VEHLALSYQFVLLLSEEFRAGHTLRATMERFLAENHGSFPRVLLDWRVHFENGQLKAFRDDIRKRHLPVFQETLFELLCLHTEGASILEPLESLEQEMRQAARFQMDTHLGQLPFKMLVPLLLFQFPSLLILIIGPMLFYLIKEVQ